MKGAIIMFNKIRFSYHLAVCEKLIRENKFIDHDTFGLTKRYKKHRNKMLSIMRATDKKKRRP